MDGAKDIATLVGQVGVPAALLFYVVRYLVAEVKGLRDDLAAARRENAQQSAQIAQTVAVMIRTLDVSDAERGRMEEAFSKKEKVG